MDLGDRGGGHGLVVELLKQFLYRAAELVLDSCSRFCAAERRQSVLQLGQVFRQLIAEDVRACRQGLAELYEAGAGLIEGPGQALARAPLGALLRHQPGQR